MTDETNTDQHSTETWLAQLNKNPKNFEAAVALGNIHYDNDQAAQSIVYYRIALEIDPKQPGIRTDMGTMYWKNGNISHAEQAFRQVIDEFAGFGNAYLNLGYLLLHAKGEAKAARALWQTLVDHYPRESATEKAAQLLKETYN